MEKLNSILNKYYEKFPDRWMEQKYLWKSVQTFQMHWDMNAPDFPSMISRATADADYLMNASLYYPRDMIINLAMNEPREVRKMFETLFDEGQDVIKRALMFNETAEALRTKYKGKGVCYLICS